MLSVVSYAVILWIYCYELNWKWTSVYKYLPKPNTHSYTVEYRQNIYGAFGLFYVDIRLESSTAACWGYKYGGNLEIWGYVRDINEDSGLLQANQAIWEGCKDCSTLKMEALCSLETSITINRQSVKSWHFRMTASREGLFGCGLWRFEWQWVLIWQWVYWRTIC